MRLIATIINFIATIIMACMIIVLGMMLTVMLNGYHDGCGWRNVVPFACSPQPSAQPTVSASAPRSVVSVRTPSRASVAPRSVQRPSWQQNPWGCGPAQPEPYRVRGNYHDLGFRANCGEAHEWSEGM